MPYYEGASVLRGNSIYMTDYPYIKTAAKLKEFLQTIPSLGTPKSVSTRWLPKVGFKSANHRPIIRILDFIGFIKSNKPTDRWRAYQAEKYPKTVLAEGIADGYRELFKLYPDANQRSDAELKGYFQKHISTGDQAINSAVGTFKALCSLADFERPNGDGSSRQQEAHVPAKQQPMDSGASASAAMTAPSPAPAPDYPTVHTDIQIHIHPDADAEQIREIFKNMARYLYDKDVD